MKYGATINNQDSPFVMAATKGHLSLVRFFVLHGAQINTKNDYGGTALSEASRRGHNDVVKFLLENNADANMKDYDNMYPISHAVLHLHHEVTRMLLLHGADANQDSTIGTPLTILCDGVPQDKRVSSLFRLVLDNGGNPNKLVHGKESLDPYWRHRSRWYTTDMLYRNRARARNYTPVSYCAAKGKLDFLKILLDHGGNMHGYPASEHPLVLACETRNNNQTSIVYALLRSDVNIILNHLSFIISDGDLEHKAKKFKTNHENPNGIA